MIQSGHKGPTSAEICSGRPPLITGEKATARAGWCQRRRRRAGHFHTERLWERTPEPWWLITADGGAGGEGWGRGRGGKSSSPAASPAGAAPTAGPHPASSSWASSAQSSAAWLLRNNAELLIQKNPPKLRSMEVFKCASESRKDPPVSRGCYPGLLLPVGLCGRVWSDRLHHICLRGNILQQLMWGRAAGGCTGAHFVTKRHRFFFFFFFYYSCQPGSCWKTLNFHLRAPVLATKTDR